MLNSIVYDKLIEFVAFFLGFQSFKEFRTFLKILVVYKSSNSQNDGQISKRLNRIAKCNLARHDYILDSQIKKHNSIYLTSKVIGLAKRKKVVFR